MQTARRSAFVGLLLAAGLAPAVAEAAPNRNHTYAATGTFNWEATGSGIASFSDGTIPIEQCTPGARDCDDTLIKLDAPGILTASTTGSSPTLADTAINIYESDAQGTQGGLLASADAATPQVAGETASADLLPGFYIVRIDFLVGEGTADVESKFEASGAAPAPGGGTTTPTPAPAANAAPTSQPKIAKSIKAAKLKSLGGTAGDDGSVAKVGVALVQKKGSKCKALTSSGSLKSTKCGTPTTFLTAKGTTSWSLKLKKRLPKGSYTVYSKATDNAGLSQATPAKATFKVS